MTKIKELPGHRPSLLIIAFNRPDKLKALLESLSHIQPERVFISLDGPRQDHPEDTELVEQCQNIANTWATNCGELVQNNERKNLGCRDHVIKAVSWFFEQNERGIILEDDCLPSPTFFDYSSELLERYGNDPRVLMISGNNYGSADDCQPYSYQFTRYISIWGWATWADRWSSFLRFFNWLKEAKPEEVALIDQTMQAAVMESQEGNWRFQCMMKSVAGGFDSWAYILSGYALSNHLLTIIPGVNLISNTGFDDRSTHTKSADVDMANVERKQMSFPLNHPPFAVSSFDYHVGYQPELRKGVIKNHNLLNKLKSKWV